MHGVRRRQDDNISDEEEEIENNIMWNRHGPVFPPPRDGGDWEVCTQIFTTFMPDFFSFSLKYHFIRWWVVGRCWSLWNLVAYCWRCKGNLSQNSTGLQSRIFWCAPSLENFFAFAVIADMTLLSFKFVLKMHFKKLPPASDIGMLDII